MKKTLLLISILLMSSRAYSGNLGSGAGSSYPTSMDNSTRTYTFNDYVTEGMINDLNKAVCQIETVLGTAPAGGYADIRAAIIGLSVSTLTLADILASSLTWSAKVSKTGDTMTGTLNINPSGGSGTNAIKISAPGAGMIIQGGVSDVCSYRIAREFAKPEGTWGMAVSGGQWNAESNDGDIIFRVDNNYYSGKRLLLGCGTALGIAISPTGLTFGFNGTFRSSVTVNANMYIGGILTIPNINSGYGTFTGTITASNITAIEQSSATDHLTLNNYVLLPASNTAHWNYDYSQINMDGSVIGGAGNTKSLSVTTFTVIGYQTIKANSADTETTFMLRVSSQDNTTTFYVNKRGDVISAQSIRCGAAYNIEFGGSNESIRAQGSNLLSFFTAGLERLRIANNGTFNFYNGLVSNFKTTADAQMVSLTVTSSITTSGAINKSKDTQGGSWSASSYTATTTIACLSVPTVISAASIVEEAGGVFGVVASSLRYKKNIVDLKYSTDDILKLSPKHFDFKTVKEGGIWKPGSRTNDDGLIAEDVFKIIPNLVILKNGKPESIRYEYLSIYLLKVIKDQETRIKKLENK